MNGKETRPLAAVASPEIEHWKPGCHLASSVRTSSVG
jgi:hypothetical protein